MKRLWMFPLFLAVLAACTPLQLATWEHTTGTELEPTDRATLLALPDAPMTLGGGLTIDVDGTITMAGRCGEWYAPAIDAGFLPEQWPTVAAIMYRESRCQPSAYNPSGASGLMQIMPMWADDCGGTPADLFDGAFNLSCAVHILRVQGWQAWAT